MRKFRKVIAALTVFLSLLFAYLANRFVLMFESLPGNLIDKLLLTWDSFWENISKQPILWKYTENSLKGCLCAFVLSWLVYLYFMFGAKKFRAGEEHGSAEWGNHKTAEKFMDKENPENNIILSQTEKIRLIGNTSDFEYDRNKNVMIVGGSGSGKTYSIVKPNIMQLHSSYVLTDPKGTLLPDVGKMLADHGYKIKVMNTINFKKSMHYNPLAYIRSEKDILKVVNVLIENTKGEGQQSTEDFWVKAERLLYSACIAYLYYECPIEDRNIPSLVNMLEYCQVSESDENYKSAVDILFEDLAVLPGKEDCFAVKQYRKFKQAAGETAKSILISCGARLAPFDIQEIKELTQYDELELDKIGDRKTAFFIIMSDTDVTFSFLVAMCLYQMFNLLCEHADDDCGGRLPIHVRCLLDEFANIGVIPNFQRLIATIRSREISAVVMLQSLAQLTPIYKDNADTIIDNCDSFVFLGGKSSKTTKQISEMVGKQTIDNRNINESKGQNASYSVNNQNLGRDLIDPAEVAKIPKKECIVIITGTAPYKSQKYNTKKHERFKQLADYDRKKIFDITKYQESEWEAEECITLGEIKEEMDLSELNELDTKTA